MTPFDPFVHMTTRRTDQTVAARALAIVEATERRHELYAAESAAAHRVDHFRDLGPGATECLRCGDCYRKDDPNGVVADGTGLCLICWEFREVKEPS